MLVAAAVLDKWLGKQPVQLQELLRDVPGAISEATPDFTAALKRGTPNYWPPEISRRTVCMINVHKDEYVRVQICNGAGIDDPESLPEGTGGFHRHLKIPQTDPELAAVTRYSRAAQELATRDPQPLAG